MRAVVQRVSRARVTVDERVTGEITRGLLAYLGVGGGDGEAEAAYLAEKIATLRVFEDERGRMSLDVVSAGGAVLVVPQFTLYGDVRKGRRPDFTAAMEPLRACELYERVVALLRARGITVATGEFRAHMMVDAVNDGPVTILVDSARTF
ncbi:MAG: D-aminoacyl-tRNA deacylase [Polyangiales bacterium]